MDDKRQTSQQRLTSGAGSRGEAPRPTHGRRRSPRAKHGTESLASTERLMEEVCERENLKRALKRVQSNKGSPGVDGMTVDALMSVSVRARSSGDGWASPDGWLWLKIIADELARMAGLSTSRGHTWADETVPVATMFRPVFPIALG